MNITQSLVRDSDCDGAIASLENTKKSWHKLKPILQLDIDHDYVNDIENNMEKLSAYLEAQEKAESLSILLQLQKSWEDIGQM